MIDADLAARLVDLEHRTRVAVERFRSVDPNPDDLFRGLYVSDDQVDGLLRGDQPDPGSVAGASSITLPAPSTALGRLAVIFDLEPLDIDLVVVALAAELDARFERFFGYLHDDLTRRRPSIGLAIDLAGQQTTNQRARSRLSLDAPLATQGLVVIDELDRPFLTRSLRVPDRVVAHLLGDDTPPEVLRGISASYSIPRMHLQQQVTNAMSGPACLHLVERTEAGAAGTAATALEAHTGEQALVFDLNRSHPDDNVALIAQAELEAKLTGRGLVMVGVDSLPKPTIRALTALAVPTVLVGSTRWDPEWSDIAVHSLTVEPPSAEEQQHFWSEELATAGLFGIVPPASFRLGPLQVRRAIAAALTGAAATGADGHSLDPEHLAVGARAQNAAGLARLARRVEPSAKASDLVLDDATRLQLEHLTARVAHRSMVLDQWGLRRHGGRGEGIIALFAGDSGTGKTLAAETIASELGLEMYVVDLSTVIDKYIGETEKNLDRIFDEAEGVNGVLFFDEADALFGKRTDVSDSRDRHANTEVAYLLQRLESFDGLGVLATNLRANIDDAFARRLSVMVEFPEPDETQRRQLWSALSAAVPLDADVDFDFAAKAFRLTGGNIRSAVVSAAYLGAARTGTVSMAEIIRAVELEYRKLGRLCNRAEFGPYYDLLTNQQEY